MIGAVDAHYLCRIDDHFRADRIDLSRDSHPIVGLEFPGRGSHYSHLDVNGVAGTATDHKAVETELVRSIRRILGHEAGEGRGAARPWRKLI